MVNAEQSLFLATVCHSHFGYLFGSNCFIIAGTSADWWSVGVILFELIVGMSAFNAEHPQVSYITFTEYLFRALTDPLHLVPFSHFPCIW